MAALPQAPILNQLPIEVECECVATNEDGTECGRFTTKGDMCPQHARSVWGVEVRLSTIPNAGDGLFATRDFRRGDIVCSYPGRIMAKGAFDANPSAYGVKLHDASVLDARRTSDGFGRYANAAQRAGQVNGQLISERKVMGRKGSGKKILLQATKPIAAGTEVLLRYGNEYNWAGGVGGL